MGINSVHMWENIFWFFSLHSLYFLVCLLFSFNLTLSQEQFFISLNIDGRYHSKLFSSPSDRTAHHACNALWWLGEMVSEETSGCCRASSSGWCSLGRKMATVSLCGHWCLLVTHRCLVYQFHTLVFSFHPFCLGNFLPGPVAPTGPLKPADILLVPVP